MRARTWSLLIVALAGVSVLVAPTVAAKKGNKGAPAFKAELSGFQEVPSISTAANGEVRVKVKKTGNGPVLGYRLTYGDIQNAFAAHIHLGQMGVNGGVSAFLCGGGGKPACPPTGGQVQGTIIAADVIGPAAQGIAPGEIAELIKAMKAGVTYVNVHTSDGNDAVDDPIGPGDFPAGEIRGQLPARGKKAS